MSDRDLTVRLGRRTLGRRAVSLLGVTAALVLICGGGSLLGAESATTASNRINLPGRTTNVCTVSKDEDSRSTVAAVAVRREPERPGELRIEPVTDGEAELKITDQGKGKTLAQPDASVLVSAVGMMATGASAAVLETATTGEQTGLMGAPCSPPTTLQWFAGVGSSETNKTELILTNPDDSQAVVDLRFFGRHGRVAVPGSPNIAVAGRSSRTISIGTLVQTEGPLSVAVRASSGRVAAVARELRRFKQVPAGADWQLAAAAPATSVVIPAVPDGDGVRRLTVTNPGTVRATVTISALGVQGAFAPAGAETLDLEPESTAEVDLTAGLAGEPGAIKLTSDQPVTGAVLSTARRDSAQGDVAIQSAAIPLVRDGVSAIATANRTDSDLILTNGSDVDTPVTFEVFSYSGVSLRTDDILLAANTTATRRLTSPAPSYVVVRVPPGSGIYGGIRLEQPEGDVAGLATIPLTSPDVASRAPVPVPNPAVGR
jgi:Family of unknown function (DUF5719)